MNIKLRSRVAPRYRSAPLGGTKLRTIGACYFRPTRTFRVVVSSWLALINTMHACCLQCLFCQCFLPVYSVGTYTKELFETFIWVQYVHRYLMGQTNCLSCPQSENFSSDCFRMRNKYINVTVDK